MTIGQWFHLKTGKYNPVDTTLYSGNFISINGADTLFTWELPAREQKSIIYNLRYLNSKKIKGEYAIVNDTIFLPKFNMIKDIFKIQQLDENSELALGLKYHFFGLIDREKDYSSQVQNCIDVAKHYPNSQYLMSNLFGWKRTFKSITDVKLIYDNFSKKNKESFFGKLLGEYLNVTFENIKLPIVNNPNIFEPLIQDSTKYNLIELTASWCSPCRELLPSLVELSKQYQDKLIITYVSVDDEKTIADFRKQIENEKIMLRCLWLNNKDNFLFRLSGSGIPKGILVCPNGQRYYLQLNLPEDLAKFKTNLSEK